MPTNAYKNLVGADASGHVTHLSLHTSGHASGGDEFSGGNYARQVPTYESSGVGVEDLASSVTFGGPGSPTAANFLGYWAGATWLGARAIPSPPTMVEEDNLEITSAPIAV